MTEQMHKRLTEEQVVMILERYIKRELSREHAMDLLGLKRRQFFEWLKKYRENLKDFTIEYSRKRSNRKINVNVEKNILKELKVEKAFSLKKTKDLLGKPEMPDEEAKRIRDDCYAIAELFLEFLLKSKAEQTAITSQGNSGED